MVKIIADIPVTRLYNCNYKKILQVGGIFFITYFNKITTLILNTFINYIYIYLKQPINIFTLISIEWRTVIKAWRLCQRSLSQAYRVVWRYFVNIFCFLFKLHLGFWRSVSSLCSHNCFINICFYKCKK